jgi:hypothetical protein
MYRLMRFLQIIDFNKLIIELSWFFEIIIGKQHIQDLIMIITG